jgi:hypothetical protein
MEKVVNKVFGAVQYTPPELKIGMGDPKVECETCKEVHVFARISGARYLAYRTIVTKDMQLGQLKAVFESIHGGPIAQESLFDENGYMFSQMDQPVWKFSNKCRLHIDFAHPEGAVFGTARTSYESKMTPKL